MIPWVLSKDEIMDLVACQVNTVPEMCRYVHPDLKPWEYQILKQKVSRKVNALARWGFLRKAGTHCDGFGHNVAIWEVAE